MNTVMTRCAIAMVVACGLLANGSARAEKLDQDKLLKCMMPVVLGTSDVKKIKFNGHEFNCKGLTGWKSRNGVTAVSGQLSHHLSARKDDQVNWSFNLDSSGVISDIELKIARGGAGSMVKRILPPVVTHRGVDLNPNGMKYFFDWTGKVWDGSWESVAQAIVGGIATHLAIGRAASRSGKIETNAYYFNVAPRAEKIRGFLIAEEFDSNNNKGMSNVAACEEKCNEERSCKVWSLKRMKGDPDRFHELQGKKVRRQSLCDIYSEANGGGLKVATHTVTGRVR